MGHIMIKIGACTVVSMIIFVCLGCARSGRTYLAECEHRSLDVSEQSVQLNVCPTEIETGPSGIANIKWHITGSSELVSKYYEVIAFELDQNGYPDNPAFVLCNAGGGPIECSPVEHKGRVAFRPPVRGTGEFQVLTLTTQLKCSINEDKLVYFIWRRALDDRIPVRLSIGTRIAMTTKQ